MPSQSPNLEDVTSVHNEIRFALVPVVDPREPVTVSNAVYDKLRTCENKLFSGPRNNLH